MHHVFPCVLVSLPCVSMFFQDLGKATKIRVTGLRSTASPLCSQRRLGLQKLNKNQERFFFKWHLIMIDVSRVLLELTFWKPISGVSTHLSSRWDASFSFSSSLLNFSMTKLLQTVLMMKLSVGFRT